MKVLIIDNYDSFVYNLVQLIGSLNTETYVYRNNEVKSDEIKKINPDRIVISPGPGNPKNPRDFGTILIFGSKFSFFNPSCSFFINYLFSKKGYW